jgi:tryptophan halogenase
MSATTLVRLLDADVTLIESPDVKIIGVGESTLFQIQSWIDLVGIRADEVDFIRKTGATLKHSIKFTNFLTKDSGSFHYPFGDEPLINPVEWWKAMNGGNQDVSFNSYAEDINPLALCAERGKFDSTASYSYHFDAVKFGEYLKKKYCKEVDHISANVVDSNINEDGIESLKLDNGKNIEADLFIDCTGFKSLLLGEFLKEPFIPYDHVIPNDSAWATHIAYTDKESQMVAYTECTAIDNGWVWNIPLWDNIGTGYVYSSKHISRDDAKKEFIDHLGTSDCEFRHIPMKVGRYKRTWVKNVVAIGLAGGFIEPLESNGLLTVHENLIALYKVLRRGKASHILKEMYNFGTNRKFDEFVDFIAIHYAFTQRRDTKYWEDIFNKDYNIESSDQLTRFGLMSFGNSLFVENNFINLGAGFHYIASGMGVSPYSAEGEITNIDKTKKDWEKVIQQKPFLYQYLSDVVYKTYPIVYK